MTTWIVDQKNFQGYAKTWLNKEGVCPYTGKTATDFEAEGFAVMNDAAYSAYQTEWENTLCGKWSEETEEAYNDALNCLPPVKWYAGGFYISERYISNISAYHQELNGHYYTCLQRWSTPREAILSDLQGWLALNRRCHGCATYRNGCTGTKNKVWTGCVYKKEA